MRRLDVGQAGDVDAVPQMREEGRWVRAPRAQKASRWRARIYVRGHDGVRRELARYAPTRKAAEHAATAAAHAYLKACDAPLTPSTPFLEAGAYWLRQIGRPESRLTSGTVEDYRKSWLNHVVPGSLRGLTLEQANNPQRLTTFLQNLADERGSAASRKAKSVLSGVLALAVKHGVLDGNAARQITSAKSTDSRRQGTRDLRRAFTREERDRIVATADALAAAEGLDARMRSTRNAAADLVAVLAATGVRIDEARSLTWSDVDLEAGTVHVRGTKSSGSDRHLNLPGWLQDRLCTRANQTGASDSFVIPSPRRPGQKWDPSNSSGAVRRVLDKAGATWAVPHTFRRTVATILDEEGVPIRRIADWLGHKDVSMTARVYLGRDFYGDKRALADLL